MLHGSRNHVRDAVYMCVSTNTNRGALFRRRLVLPRSMSWNDLQLVGLMLLPSIFSNEVAPYLH